MTMYLPNSELDPTGVEPGEFVDEFTGPYHADQPGDRSSSRVGGHDPPREAPTMHLDAQTRLDITRSAEEYIAGMVETYHGDRDDVRAVMRDLHHRANVGARADPAP
jgi:hypothetical protein